VCFCAYVHGGGHDGLYISGTRTKKTQFAFKTTTIEWLKTNVYFRVKLSEWSFFKKFIEITLNAICENICEKLNWKKCALNFSHLHSQMGLGLICPSKWPWLKIGKKWWHWVRGNKVQDRQVKNLLLWHFPDNQLKKCFGLSISLSSFNIEEFESNLFFWSILMLFKSLKETLIIHSKDIVTLNNTIGKVKELIFWSFCSYYFNLSLQMQIFS
jgi:hypothetical protein